MQEISRDLSSLRGLLHQHWKGSITNETILDSIWNSETAGYSFGKHNDNYLVFKRIDFGRKVRPVFDSDLAEINLKLGINIKHHTDKSRLGNIETLGVDFSVSGYFLDDDENEKDVVFSWHLDKDKKEAKEHEFTHALYHLNFGGTAMTKPKEEDIPWDFGSLLLMETPRFVHHPMDVVLAVDFILRNFYKEERHIKITEQKAYKLLLKKAADRYLKPYYQGIMSKWNKDIETDLSPEYLLPSLSF